MFLLALKDRKDEGAYAVNDRYGDKVLFLFEEEDDAVRYALLLEEDEDFDDEMEVVEVETDIALRTCRMYNYKYTVIKPDDIVVPPKIT